MNNKNEVKKLNKYFFKYLINILINDFISNKGLNPNIISNKK